MSGGSSGSSFGMSYDREIPYDGNCLFQGAEKDDFCFHHELLSADASDEQSFNLIFRAKKKQIRDMLP